ncbi:MAG: hypothetical protein KJZ69_16220 [Phycisphaerales bacterium]|nr:hypothetical protein [Phycisphaerales bacterium]
MRALTSNLVSPAGTRSAAVLVEWGKFTAYGRGPQSRFFGIGVPLPIGLPAGDRGPQSRFDVIGVPFDSDFDTDTGDVDTIKTWVAAYDVRADLDLDGDIDATDGTLAEGYEGWQLGWNELSHSTVANRIGYAGYHKDVNLDISHVRNRVLDPHLGRWTRRDPLGYVDGMSLYEYVASMPTTSDDPHGLFDPIRSHFPAPCPPQGPCIPIDPFRRPPPPPRTSPISPWSPAPGDPAPVPLPSPGQLVPWPGDGSFNFDLDLTWGGSKKCCSRGPAGLLYCITFKGSCQTGPCRCCPSNEVGLETKCKFCISLSVHVFGPVGCKDAEPDFSLSHGLPPEEPDCCKPVGHCNLDGCIAVKASFAGQSVSCDWCFGKPRVECKATWGVPKLKGPDVSLAGTGCITCTIGTTCQRYFHD